MINTLCLGSGGLKGLCLIGAIKILINNKYINMNDINLFVGTSVGSLISFLLILDFSCDEIIEIMISFDLAEVKNNVDIELFLEKFGFNDGTEFVNKMTELLYKKTQKKTITFEELYQLTNKKIIILGTNFTRGIEAEFSVDKTPNMSVILALRISTSIPIFFTPIKLTSSSADENNDYYVDGGLFYNIGLHKCNPKTTLGIKINEKSYNKLESLYDLIYGSINISINRVNCDINKYNIINVDLDNIDFPCKFEDDVNDEMKMILLNYGSHITKKFLKNYYNNKIEILKEAKYKKIMKIILDEIIQKIEKL